jgi:acetyl esterase/lipase
MLLPATSWSRRLALTIPLYRLGLYSVRNSIESARKIVQLISSSSIPNDTLITPLQIPRTAILPSKLPGMKYKETLGFINAEYINHTKENDQKRIVLYLHGGAYVFSSKENHRMLTTRIAKESDTKVLAISYRLAPEHPFPIPLHDAFSAYLYLLKTYDPKQIVLAGDSAGGGLCMSLSCILINTYLNSITKR